MGRHNEFSVFGKVLCKMEMNFVGVCGRMM